MGMDKGSDYPSAVKSAVNTALNPTPQTQANCRMTATGRTLTVHPSGRDKGKDESKEGDRSRRAQAPQVTLRPG
jgi:hypothetical protein